jgi:lysophospholipase L1-like esterase
VSAPTYLSWPFEERLEARDLDPVYVLGENPPIYLRRNLNNMIAVARENGVDIMLATWAYSPYLNDYASEGYYQAGFQENNEVVRAAANQHGVPLFDFVKVMPQDKQYWADGRHVNEAGALLKASLFAEFIAAQGFIER